MTSSSRRALPWLVSIGAHVVLLLLVGLVLTRQAAVRLTPRVDITFAGSPGAGRGALRPARAETRGQARPMPPSSIAPAGEAAMASPRLEQSADAVGLATSRAVPGDSVPAPRANDVLADLASVSTGVTGSPSGTVVGFEGVQRRLMRYRTPEVPTVLSANGQEVECEFRISIAPSGIITRVEITKSSGYIEVDASVAAALRDRLYSRVDGTIDTAETVHFSFRLEKQD